MAPHTDVPPQAHVVSVEIQEAPCLVPPLVGLGVGALTSGLMIYLTADVFLLEPGPREELPCRTWETARVRS